MSQPQPVSSFTDIDLVSNYVKLVKWMKEELKESPEQYDAGLKRVEEYEDEMRKRGIDPEVVTEKIKRHAKPGQTE